MQTDSTISVPIRFDLPVASIAVPISIGIPFPKGALFELANLQLIDAANRPILVQTKPLALWHDCSVRWAQFDFVGRNLEPGKHEGKLVERDQRESTSGGCCIETRPNLFLIDTGIQTFVVSQTSEQSFLNVRSISCDSTFASVDVRLTDKKGVSRSLVITSCAIESAGPVRVTLRIEAEIGGRSPCRFVMRCCFFERTKLLRLAVTIHNPRRSRHRGGLWDLGDPGSMKFKDLSVVVRLAQMKDLKTKYVEDSDSTWKEVSGSFLEIYQDSSGGENWQSRNHVNYAGQVACTFRGYRVKTEAGQSNGLRANPVVQLQASDGTVSAAIPEFWQQFPKAIEASGNELRLRLFPDQFGDLFELQGGEQKTHPVWLRFDAEDSLAWIHHPAYAWAAPEWYLASGAFPEMTAAPADSDRFEGYVGQLLAGPRNLFDKREVIDEYGWRHFGDIYADHENAYYSGPKPVISHFNNQFDPLLSTILQFVRTGDTRWRQLFDPLARHVIDIDIYHTEQDRAAYRGGLFWMTDHYRDAATSTHRTYSRHNQIPGQSYGGGPGSAHNFTTGLLYYYYLTCDPKARDAVLSLADWVIRMDDGRLNFFSWLDDGPTGLASYTTEWDYHGPGRGAGLSINSQIDAWLLTGQVKYRNKADELMRRCTHPNDDIEKLDLLNSELRWSYTVYLVSLARYLRCKHEANEHDESYTYGRATLLHYAKWMLHNEQPYFERRSQLQYPTETWPAQDLRKANVMRMAASHAETDLRQQLLGRAAKLADRAWVDLLGFPTSHSTRAAAIVLTEGARDQYYCRSGVPIMPPGVVSTDFGKPERFAGQKQRIKKNIRRPFVFIGRVIESFSRRVFKGKPDKPSE